MMLRSPVVRRRLAPLFRAAAPAVALALALVAPGAAFGYVPIRTSDGVATRWNLVSPQPNVVEGKVDYFIDVTGTVDNLNAAPADEFQAVQASFQRWEDLAASKIAFRYKGASTGRVADGNDNTNLIIWVNTLPTGIFAITTTTFDTQGTISDADMELNEKFVWFTSGAIGSSPAPSGTPGRADIENIVTHEAGHFIGFDHTFIGLATMYATSDNGYINLRTLEPDDQAIAGSTYAEPAFATTFGAVAGRVTRSQGTQGVFGAFVTLIDTTTLSPVVGTHTSVSGHYRVEGVPAGAYYAFVGPMNPAHLGQAFYSGIQSSFVAEFYNNVVAPGRPQVLTVAAGGEVANINLDVDLTGTPNEPNNSGDTATSVSVGEFTAARIETQLDADWYKIPVATVARKVVISVDAFGIGSSLDAELKVYDAANLSTPITGSDDRDSTAFNLDGSNTDPRIGTFTAPYTIDANKDLRLKVAAFNGKTDGFYVLSIVDPTASQGVSATASTVTAAPTSVAAGGQTDATITATLKNGFGDAVTAPATVKATTTAGTLTSGPNTGAANVTLLQTAEGSGVYTATLRPGANPTAATVTVTAEGVALSPVTVYFTGPIAAAQSTISAAPAAVFADGATSAVLSVQPRDALGNPVIQPNPQPLVVFSATAGTLVGTPAFNATTGAVTQSLRSTTAPARSTVGATIDGAALTATATVDFTLDPALAPDANRTTFTASRTSIPADGASSITLTVEPRNSSGDPILSNPEVRLFFTDSQGGQEIAGFGALSDADPAVAGAQAAMKNPGVFQATFTSSTDQRQQRLAAMVGATRVTKELVISTTGPVDAAATELTVDKTKITAGTLETATATVAPRDANNFPIIDENLQVAFAVTPVGATQGNPVFDSATGRYTQTVAPGSTAGTANVSVLINGAPIAATATIEVAPAPVVVVAGSSSSGGCGGCAAPGTPFTARDVAGGALPWAAFVAALVALRARRVRYR
ncbi:MAG: hypothetical protein HY719_05320 [Planctomycetes bacterium]|nr:hypothetical protein [Planctomycetota bacterium]